MIHLKFHMLYSRLLKVVDTVAFFLTVKNGIFNSIFIKSRLADNVNGAIQTLNWLQYSTCSTCKNLLIYIESIVQFW